MTAAQRRHVTRVKEYPCVVCDAPGPSEAHEIEQGLWYTSIPLCPICHRDTRQGWHGEKMAWKLRKLDEIKALDRHLGRMLA